MDVSGRRIWQVSAGDEDCHWADLCLEWDVILDGPDSEGPWPGCLESLRSGRGFHGRRLSDLRRFCKEVQDGDLVVLRAGTSNVYGVGVVVGGYTWHEEFRDIDGWDYGHVRRVRWLWRYGDAPRRFARHTLRPGDTVQVMDAKSVLEWLEGLPVDQEAWRRPLRGLPEPSRDSDWEEISAYLLNRGVADAVVKRLLAAVVEVKPCEEFFLVMRSSEAKTHAGLVGEENMHRVYRYQRVAVRCVPYKKDGAFGDRPYAYLNLTRMRDAYPVVGYRGAKDVLLYMAADWVPARFLFADCTPPGEQTLPDGPFGGTRCKDRKC